MAVAAVSAHQADVAAGHERAVQHTGEGLDQPGAAHGVAGSQFAVEQGAGQAVEAELGVEAGPAGFGRVVSHRALLLAAVDRLDRGVDVDDQVRAQRQAGDVLMQWLQGGAHRGAAEADEFLVEDGDVGQLGQAEEELEQRVLLQLDEVEDAAQTEHPADQEQQDLLHQGVPGMLGLLVGCQCRRGAGGEADALQEAPDELGAAVRGRVLEGELLGQEGTGAGLGGLHSCHRSVFTPPRSLEDVFATTLVFPANTKRAKRHDVIYCEIQGNWSRIWYATARMTGKRMPLPGWSCAVADRPRVLTRTLVVTDDDLWADQSVRLADAFRVFDEGRWERVHVSGLEAAERMQSASLEDEHV